MVIIANTVRCIDGLRETKENPASVVAVWIQPKVGITGLISARNTKKKSKTGKGFVYLVIRYMTDLILLNAAKLSH